MGQKTGQAAMPLLAPSFQLLLDVLCHRGVGADAILLHERYQVPFRQAGRRLGGALAQRQLRRREGLTDGQRGQVGIAAPIGVRVNLWGVAEMRSARIRMATFRRTNSQNVAAGVSISG